MVNFNKNIKTFCFRDGHVESVSAYAVVLNHKVGFLSSRDAFDSLRTALEDCRKVYQKFLEGEIKSSTESFQKYEKLAKETANKKDKNFYRNLNKNNLPILKEYQRRLEATNTLDGFLSGWMTSDFQCDIIYETWECFESHGWDFVDTYADKVFTTAMYCTDYFSSKICRPEDWGSDI